MPDPFLLLAVGPSPEGLEASVWGPFKVHRCADLDAAAQALRQQSFDALLVWASEAADVERLAMWPALSQAVLDAAVVLVKDSPQPAEATRWLAAGVQDVLPPTAAETLAQHLRLSIERKRLERAARKAYATDLATGLPNHAQLLEHMSHLMALREREPAPMAVLALRIEGLATTAATMGPESAQVLRRKVAVRLRSGLRVSDVVAAIGHDVFAVLLAWIDHGADGARVADKLVRSLHQPFRIAGREVAVAVSAGIGLYPEQGVDPDSLLRLALGQAAQSPASGRAGFANRVERGASSAANDDEA
jgi:diguanylate cyclase (GGDEF)-like protein